MKTKACFPFAVFSSEIDGPCGSANQKLRAIKESDSNVASTNSPISVVVPGVHLTLERGAVGHMKTCVPLPRATSTENSGQPGHDNHLCRAAEQE